MSQAIKCPKCKSDKISAQKHGFSAGKAVAGVVLTGGVGALAGLHGSNKLELHCMQCGNVWNPVTEHKRQQTQKQVEYHKKQQIWVKRFRLAYESGNYELAERLANEKRPARLKNGGLEAVYQEVVKEEKTAEVVKLILLTIVLLSVLGIVYMCS